MTISTDSQDPSSAPDLVNDPYPYFEHMRKTAPVWRGTLMESDLMPDGAQGRRRTGRLFDFESVFAAFREDTVFASEMYNNTIGLVFGPTILGMHGKQHHDHRSLVSKAFRQSALNQWEPEVIDPICDQLVDEFKNDGEADLVKAVTFEFPTRVTAALLGLPQEDLEMFRRLSLDLISITEDIEAGLTASVELGTYFQEQVDQRRSTMTDDIIGDLVAAEIDGEKLTDEAIISFLRLLLPAGLETTYRSSGNLLQLLLTHPDQLEALQQDREPHSGRDRRRDPLRDAVGPGGAQHHPRRRDARHARSRRARRSTCAWVRPIATNRGGPKPDVFDIHRPRRAHISFAGGIHSCLGMHLATGRNQGDAQQPLRSGDRPAAAARTTTPRSSACRSARPSTCP